MRKLWTLLLPAVFAFALLGCSSDDDTTDPTTLTSAEQFAAVHDALIGYVNSEAPAVKAVNEDLLLDIQAGDYTILDFRASSDYNTNHIPGSYDVSLGNLLDQLNSRALPTDKPFLAVCYTGQSAGHGVIALRALGYEAYSVKFGMSAWHTSLDKWSGNCASGAAFETTDNPAVDIYDFPSWDEGAATEEEAVEARVAAMLEAGFKGITYSTMVTNGLDNYFIINYFGEADYNGTGDSGIPGHLEGAYQFTPQASMGMDEMLEYIPTDMPVVVYCWTGQTSSQMTAYLNMLGYEAYSLKFGSNNLWYDQLTGHKWSSPGLTYPFEGNFAASHDATIDYVNTSAPAVIAASNELWLDIDAGDYTVLDVRSEEDYNISHIPGAYHTGLGTLLDDMTARAFPMDEPFLVACYTGQSAGHVVIALRALGYEAYSLKFGMSAWHSSLDKWTTNTGSGATYETTPNALETTYSWPILDTTYVDDATSVYNQVAAMLAGGFKGKNYSDLVIEGLDNYFIINYFGVDDYNGTGGSGIPGHLEGAYQYTPQASFGMDELLMYVPTDMPVIVYCWTGQTSSQMTAYLNMLGYEAYSLKFGSNNLWYELLTGHKWSQPGLDLPLE